MALKYRQRKTDEETKRQKEVFPAFWGSSVIPVMSLKVNSIFLAWIFVFLFIQPLSDTGTKMTRTSALVKS